MNTPPYEESTDDLRQVRERHGAHEYLTIQRKWRVQDGEARKEPYWYHCAADEVKVYPPTTVTMAPESVMVSCSTSVIPPTWVVKLKEEWRDLPTVIVGTPWE